MPDTSSVPAVKRDELEAVLALLEESERAGRTVEQVAATWRFAGISDPNEVFAWLDVGVFDGHRAGLLKLAGIRPNQLLRVPESRKVGLALSMGQLSIGEVTRLIAALDEGDDGARGN